MFKQLGYIINKFRWVIAAILVLLIIIVGTKAFMARRLHQQADAESLVFSKIQETLIGGDKVTALASLKELQKSGTIGYKFLAYLQQATILVNQKKYPEAEQTLTKINALSLPSYYKDLANTIINYIKLDNAANLTGLIANLKQVSKDNPFYFDNLQILAMSFYYNKQYSEAISTADEIITSDDASSSTKETAKALKSVALAYVK